MEAAKSDNMFYELDNTVLHAQISDYGAKLTRLIVPNDKGEKADVVLGFNTEEEWRTQETYFNAIIGRYANRIKDGIFTLDGKTYHLPVNNGTNCLHGGVSGWNEKTWDVVEHDDRHIVLHLHSADGEEGFPGNVEVYVTYALTDDNGLSISYRATTDAPTVISITNHAYFNLNGETSPSVRNHRLQVLADYYTPLDDSAAATGEIAPVENTAMDFRQPQLIGDRIDDPFFVPGRGIDNNWVLDTKPSATPRLAAVVKASGRTMEVYTTCPGIQVYTGNYVENHIGKGGTMYRPQNAVCLEAQNLPNAVNHDSFPSPVLRPGETYTQETIYKFL